MEESTHETSTFEKEYRCPNDNKLLFKGLIVEGEIEIKCKQCKDIIDIAPTPLKDIICKKGGCANRVQ